MNRNTDASCLICYINNETHSRYVKSASHVQLINKFIICMMHHFLTCDWYSSNLLDLKKIKIYLYKFVDIDKYYIAP